MDLGRDAGALAAQQQDVVEAEGHVGEAGRAVGGEQDQPAGRCLLQPVALEGGPGGVADDRRAVEIVHGGAAHAAVVEREAAGLYDVQRRAEAGAQSYEGAEILRNIGLEQGEAHGSLSAFSRFAKGRIVRHVVTERP